MRTADEIKVFMLKANIREIIADLMNESFIKREFVCTFCANSCKLVSYKKSTDGFG
jgi:hypothetical protein